MAEILGDAELAAKVTNAAINLYTKASEYAAEKGIIIADTKFEFGLDENNNLVLVDEVLTPGKCICYRWASGYTGKEMIMWGVCFGKGHLLMTESGFNRFLSLLACQQVRSWSWSRKL